MYEIKYNVGHSCMGLDGRMKTASILDFVQDCNLHHLESLPDLTDFFRETGSSMYVAYRQLIINRRPEYDENVNVRTWSCGTRSMYGYRNTVIYDKNDNILVLSSEIGVLVDLATGKPFRFPRELEEKLPKEPAVDTGYFERKIILPPVQPEFTDMVLVRRYHCDNYGHMNNAKYVEIAEEYLPEDLDPARIRVEYKIPAFKGMKIRIYTYKHGETFAVKFTDDQEKTLAVVEFLG